MHTKYSGVLIWMVLILILPSLLVCSQWAYGQDRQGYLPEEIRFALAGDAIITRKISPYRDPQFLAMVDIIRGADLSFVNCEMLFFNYGEAFPAAQSGGTWMRAAPKLIDELKWAGFDMCSAANNHSLDYGIHGLIANMNHLREHNMPFAGIGMNLAEAQAPVYVEKDAGRVALLSVSSTYAPGDNAGPQRKDMLGRPGLNPLLYKSSYKVSSGALDLVKELARETGISIGESEGVLRFLGTNFELEGEEQGRVLEIDETNIKEIAATVRDAKRQADWVIINSHTHEGNGDIPPKFLVQFAHAVIDAGADIVVVNGYHALRPIEIYKDRPIFYSLGDFLFQNETVEKLPGDFFVQYNVSQDSLTGYVQDKRIDVSGPRSFVNNKGVWQSVVAIPIFKNATNQQDGKLTELILYPISLGYKAPRAQRGRPRLADKQEGRKIIEHLIELSQPYGTIITYDPVENVGKILLNK